MHYDQTELEKLATDVLTQSACTGSRLLGVVRCHDFICPIDAVEKFRLTDNMALDAIEHIVLQDANFEHPINHQKYPGLLDLLTVYFSLAKKFDEHKRANNFFLSLHAETRREALKALQQSGYLSPEIRKTLRSLAQTIGLDGRALIRRVFQAQPTFWQKVLRKQRPMSFRETVRRDALCMFLWKKI